MESVPLIRPDALHYREDFEKTMEAETDPRRRAFLSFVQWQSYNAVSKANAENPPGGVVTLDMRGVAALANCMFDHQGSLLKVLTGEIKEEDWSE